ncbi:MAG TPA: hypothetical protein VI300_04490 [Solirubrobacter sp.]
MGSPTFSPDGGMLAMQFGGEVWIADIPDLAGGCQSPTFFKRLLAGAQPDWGPADVPAATGTPVEQPKSAPSPGPITDRPPAPKQAAMRLTLPKGLKLRTALRKGITATVNPGTAGRLTATAMLKRSKLGSGAAKVGASGKAKVRIRFTRKASRVLRQRRSVRLTISVRFTPARGVAVSRSVPLTVKR